MGLLKSGLRCLVVLATFVLFASLAALFATEHVMNAFNVVCFGQFARRGNKPFVELQLSKQVAYVFDKAVLVEEKQTAFQYVEVYAHPEFGHILVIDGSLQITERDEHVYHEMSAHLPLAYLPDAKKALIIGGGDGGVLTRVLQHRNIEHAALVDIDMYAMRDFTQSYFPHLFSAFLDRRTKAYAYDGNAWLDEQLEDSAQRGTYDLVVIDSTDYGSAETLFTDAFYAKAKRMLRSSGADATAPSIMLLNLDSPSWNPDIVASVQRQLAAVFKYAFVYQAHQPTFLSGHYSFLMCSDTVHPMKTRIDWPRAWSDKNIAVDYYSPELHFGSFLLHDAVRRELSHVARLSDVPAGGFYTGGLRQHAWPTADVPETRMSEEHLHRPNTEADDDDDDGSEGQGEL